MRTVSLSFQCSKQPFKGQRGEISRDSFLAQHSHNQCPQQICCTASRTRYPQRGHTYFLSALSSNTVNWSQRSPSGSGDGTSSISSFVGGATACMAITMTADSLHRFYKRRGLVGNPWGVPRDLPSWLFFFLLTLSVPYAWISNYCRSLPAGVQLASSALQTDVGMPVCGVYKFSSTLHQLADKEHMKGELLNGTCREERGLPYKPEVH